MSDENSEVVESVNEEAVVAEDATPEEVNVAPALSEAEQEAMSRGWRPKDEYKGDPDDWVTAKQFLKKGELYGKINDQTKYIKDLTAAVDVLTKKVKESESSKYEDKLDQVRSQRAAAVEVGDMDKFYELEEKYLKLQEKMLKAQVAEQQTAVKQDTNLTPEQSSAVQEFIDRNASWYNSVNSENAKMMTYAQSVAKAIADSNPHFGPKQVLRLVEEDVKKTFSSRFTNANRAKPSAVAASDKTKSGGSEDPLKGLTAQQKKLAKEFAETGVMTVEEYAKQVKQIYNR